jgi:hypothetical protein
MGLSSLSKISTTASSATDVLFLCLQTGFGYEDSPPHWNKDEL